MQVKAMEMSLIHQEEEVENEAGIFVSQQQQQPSHGDVLRR